MSDDDDLDRVLVEAGPFTPPHQIARGSRAEEDENISPEKKHRFVLARLRNMVYPSVFGRRAHVNVR